MLPSNKLQGILFTYDTKYKSNKERVNFHRKLYGSISYTIKGPKKQGGLLSEISFLNPTKSCLIVKVDDSEKLRSFFKKHQVMWSEHLVMLNEKESKSLRL